MRRTLFLLLALLVSFAVPACSSDDSPIGFGSAPDDTGDSGTSDVSDEGTEDDDAVDLGALLGAGGGGTLRWDGEDIEIASVTCMLDGELFDVGTVSDNGFRVFVSWTNAANPKSIQVLDADFLQWFPEFQTDELVRDGSTFSSPPTTYWNNSDDRMVEASFTIECP